MRTRLAALAALAVAALWAPLHAQSSSSFSVSGPGGTLVDYSGPILWFENFLPNSLPAQPALVSSVTVPNDVTSVDSIVLTQITHSLPGNLHAILRDPTGKGYSVFARPGFTGISFPTEFVTGGNPGSTLTFVPAGGQQMSSFGAIPTGTYAQYAGVFDPPWPSGYLNVFTTNLGSITGPPGTWSLQVLDWEPNDVGALQGWTLNAQIVVTGAQFCYGDGTNGPCPCGNQGTPGRGCENSASTGGGRLVGTGHPRLSGDTVVLRASGMLPTVNCIYLQGDAAVAPLIFGDGLRCAGGILKRLYLKAASGGVALAPNVAGGDETVSARSATLGDPLSPGLSRHYQTYYRDPNPGFCANPPGNTWNVTSGLSITWAP